MTYTINPDAMYICVSETLNFCCRFQTMSKMVKFKFTSLDHKYCNF